MKTFSDDALAALERGDAIVSASVEIIPENALTYTLVDTVNLDAVTNCSHLTSDAASVGVTLSGFDPTDVIRVTTPPGETFAGWTFQNSAPDAWVEDFDVVPDGVEANSFKVTEVGIFPSTGDHSSGDHFSAEDARSVFGVHTFTGASAYTFWIMDVAFGGGDGSFDNDGGVSIRVEKANAPSAGTAIRLWGGYGDLDLPSDSGTSTFSGIGDHGLIQSSSGAIGGTAQNTTLALSGIEAAALDVLDAAEVKNASVVVRRLIFDSAGKTLLGAYVYSRGRLDELRTSEIVGGGAAIQVAVEGAARGLGRRGGRARSDADQRLVSSTDGFFKSISFVGKKTLYWGGKKPATMG